MGKYFTIMTILSMFLCGCGRGGEKDSKLVEPGIVDYITGREQIKIYQKTKAKIEDINKTSKERNARF